MEEKKPWPVSMKREKRKLTEVNLPERKLGLDISKREGVFVHSFVCNGCGVHFNVYSWQANRHRVNNVYCPECGKTGSFRHWRITLSENPEFKLEGNEIFKYCNTPGSELMSDTKKP